MIGRSLVHTVAKSKQPYRTWYRCFYTLLKSDVTRRDHMVVVVRSQECGSRFVNFACQFHSWRHSLSHNSEIYNIGVQCAVVTSKPRNRANGASDVWAFNSIFIVQIKSYCPVSHISRWLRIPNNVCSCSFIQELWEECSQTGFQTGFSLASLLLSMLISVFANIDYPAAEY